MARPKKNPEEVPQDATEREPAHDTVVESFERVYVPPPPPPPKRISVERRGGPTAPAAVVYPDIRGGVCEYCGVLDPRNETHMQYKLCPHFRGLDARCSYCPESKDPNDVVYHSNLKVWEYPIGSGTLVMLCNSFSCAQAHEKRFKSSL